MLLVYWFLILIDLKSLVYSQVYIFFSFLLQRNYLKKCLLFDSLVLIPNNSFLHWLLQAWYQFFHIFLFFSSGKLHYLSTWEDLFRNHFLIFRRYAFISMCGFNQAFWLNLMTLLTLVNTYLWFNACFKFVTCQTYSL